MSSLSLQVFPHLVPFLLPLAQISLAGSLYTTMAVAMERLITVSRYIDNQLAVGLASNSQVVAFFLSVDSHYNYSCLTLNITI